MNASELTVLTSIDLFSGSGAVTAALFAGGFKVIAAVDQDPIACRTYRANHEARGVDLIEDDIGRVDPRAIVREHPEAHSVDLMVVCAPCQPFSNQNQRRGADDRSLLVHQGPRFAEVLEPKCILFENVPGLTGSSGRAVLADLQARLDEIGYHLSQPRKINAADLGVPQRRIRCVLVASRHRSIVSAFEAADLKREPRTVEQAIGHLPRLSSGERDPADPLHFARVHRPVVLQRLAAIPKDGGSRTSLPTELALVCHRGRRGFPDVYGRMRWGDVAPTLTTGCNDLTRGRFAHPDQDRAITLREAATLQTFPPDYVFEGNRRQIATQIGNAVPIDMVAVLLPILREAIEELKP